ncbi:MAG: T9SS type A sorting domain-containing protein [Flavobacteriales bacterium]|nr:T9SS type A sorting domain-containing protein [Flavobacteriales bacterium]
MTPRLRLLVESAGYEPDLKVYASSDRGETWTNWDPNNALPNLPINDLVLQSGTDEGIYVAMDIGVYYRTRTTDWQPYFADLPNVQVRDLDINYCAGKIRAGTYGRGLWESDLAEQPSVHLVIDENTTWSFHRNLAQTVRITNGSTLTITSTANFAPGTYLIVEPGAQLIVNGGTLTNSCGEYWGGVQVWGNSAMNQSGGFVGGQYRPTLHQGYLELRNGGVIENALVGAMLNNPLAEDAEGGVIRMVNGTMRNCQQGVVIADYMNFGSTTNVPASNRSSFINSTFTVTDALPGGDDFREHVRMSGVSGIVFSGCTFKNEQTTITESAKLGYGIHSLDANYKVKGLCQGPPPVPADCPSTIVQRTTFTGLDHGIHALEGASNRSFQVDNTTFTDNICGVYSEGVVGFKVVNSRFEVGGNGVATMSGDFDPGFLGFHRGVFSTTGYGFIVDDNRFERSGSAPTEGLVVGYSGDHSDMVFRNTASGLDAAYIGEGVCADPSNRSYIGLHFQCNTNADNGTNLWSRQVDDEATEPEQTIRTHQGKLFRAPDNAFDRLSGNWDIRNTNYPANVLTYWWKAPEAPHQPIHVDPPGGALVTNNSNGTPVNRPEGNCASRRVIFTYPYPPRREPLMSGLMEHRDVYVANKYLHKTLLDGGSTDELVEEVVASWPEEVWLLRTSLLQKSPFLTVEVLEEMMMKPILPMAIKAEICIANPDATKSEGFLEFLVIKAEPPMPANLVASVEASWQTKTFRTELEGNLAHDHGEMTQNANLLLEYFGTDSVEHVDSLRGVWQLIRTPAARYAEALTYLQQQNFEAAKAVIEDLPEEHVLKVKQESERWRMLALIEYLQGVNNDGRTVAQLTTGEQEALEAIIADERDRPATWAQNILCFHYGKCRAPLTGDAKAVPKSRQVNKRAQGGAAEASMRIYPNPASKYATVAVHFGAELEQAVVVVQDAVGREMLRIAVQYEDQQVLLDTRDWPSGAYAIRQENGGKVLTVERLVIER